jgi:hypothetical protein
MDFKHIYNGYFPTFHFYFRTAFWKLDLFPSSEKEYETCCFGDINQTVEPSQDTLA